VHREVPGVEIDEGATECPHCGLTYADLRTGLTYKEVRDMYWTSSTDSKDWKYKRRNTVLGKWRELKLSIWREHLYLCESLAVYEEMHGADHD
jgi:hypothetical protein